MKQTRTRGFGAVEIIVLLVVVGVTAFIGIQVYQSNKQATTPTPAATRTATEQQGPPDLKAKVITHNFIDLAQYVQISKFRSCEGHDFSGLNINAQPETNRSMKHYLEVGPAFKGSTNKLTLYAPFDGTITMLEKDNRGHRLGVTSSKDDHWMMLFFHSDPAEGLTIGSTVKAGQKIGAGNLAGGSDNFDVTLEWLPGGNSQEIRYDSPLLHMNDAVLSEYKVRGLTPENLVISKADRDANACLEFKRQDTNWVVIS